MDEGTSTTQLLTSLETSLFEKCHKVSFTSSYVVPSCGHFELPVSIVSHIVSGVQGTRWLQVTSHNQGELLIHLQV